MAKEVSKVKWIIIVIVLLGWTTGALASCDPDIVRSWQRQRDAAAIKLLKHWVHGAAAKDLHRDILALTRFEVFLATCTGQAESYLAKLPSGDLNRLPGSLFVQYSRRHGVHLDPTWHFAGQRFYMLAPLAR